MTVANTTAPATHSQSSDAEITVHTRRLVFENSVFSIYADHVADKNGNEVPQYLSVVPNCLLDGAIAGVVVLPVDGGRVGLIRVFRHPLGQWSWEAIKGHVEPGEGASAAAVRELLEEAGFSVASEDLVDLGAVAPEAGVIKARSRLFAATVTGKAGIAVDGELGHGELVFYNRKEIRNLITQGEIEDASTLVTIFKHQFNQSSFE